MSTLHYSVMKTTAIDLLDIDPNGIYVDMTLGRGGHTSLILSKLDQGHLYAFDKDQQAIDYCAKRFKDSPKITLIHDDYTQISAWLHHYGVGQVNGILADLGVSSPQFDDATRGFSYRYDAPLDMRMDQRQSKTAATIVNTYSLQQLTWLFKTYGEHPFAAKIASAIVEQRAIQPIQTTFELVKIIKSALPAKVLAKKGHPAKQIFQALRIEVNGELDGLKNALDQIHDLVKPHGRVVIITFHSLEDRLVKHTFTAWSSIDPAYAHLPLTQDQLPKTDYQLITKKPIEASIDELDENHRSHSAKLRCVKRN